MRRYLRSQVVSVLPIVAGLILFADAFGQKAPPAVPDSSVAEKTENATPSVEDKKSPVSALDSVRESIVAVDREIEELSARIEAAPEVQRESLETELKALEDRRDELQGDFDSIATGIDPEEYDDAVDEVFVLADELDLLVRPIIKELKDLTEKPREIEKLRGELATWKRRLETTESALENLEELPPDARGELAARIAETRRKWAERKKQAENRVEAIKFQLQQAEENRPSFFNSITNSLRSFFRSRGRNLILCLFVFIGVFLIFRYAHRRLDHLAPWRKKGKRPFYVRLVDVGLNVFSLIGAVVATLIVLYATGDWVLMGVAIIMLFGLALAAKSGIPAFYEQGRLLLNFGEVREGERIVYNGIPWRITRLSFYTILKNEHLRGGIVRLPVGMLSGLTSRPIAEAGEQWFPCDEGDWLMMPDEGHARVVSQTPEYVTLIKLGGAIITIPTADFLSKSPRNLSHNFRISTVFGIDYKHQPDCTTKIPQKMWAHLTSELIAQLGDKELLLSLKVELAAAGASSLDYAIIADFDGQVAPKYQVLERAITRILVDCCNENGYVIPFTQITLHNAFPEDPPEEVEVIEPKSKLP